MTEIKSEESITITKSDLERLVSEQVAKQLKGDKGNPRMIFSEIMIRQKDFKVINKKYKATSAIKNHIGEPDMGHPLSLKKYGNGISSNHMEYHTKGADIWNAHDFLRKATLLLFGVSKNVQLPEKEWQMAQDFYGCLKELYLDLYEERVKQLEPDDFED